MDYGKIKENMRNKWRGVLIVFGFILFLVALPTERRMEKTSAKAASLSAYPTYCLGGWENPGNAAGEPNVPEGDDSFSSSNSAFLNQKSAQIFCGYFQSNDKSYPPKSVVLKFSWKMVFGNQPVQPATSSANTDENMWASIINSTSTITSTTTSTSDFSEPIIINDTSSSIDEATSTPSSTEIIPTTDIPTSTATSSSTSFFWNFLMQKVFAQSEPLAQGFLNVSYNLEDGKNWQSAGQVTEINWRGLSISIPVTSWDDIEKLQVQLTPNLAVDMPEIYLDGMWLEVDYDHSILDTMKDGANAVLNAASSVGDTINNAFDTVANAVDSILNPNTVALIPAVIQETSLTVHRHNLSVGAETPIGVAPLPWISASETHNNKNIVTDAPPNIISTGENSIQIQGACSNDYVTILLFAHPTDYLTDPSLALFDKVYKCVNGEFNQQFSDNDFPSSLSGTYYLLTADQGERGPWKPRSTIYRISFSDSTSTSSQ